MLVFFVVEWIKLKTFGSASMDFLYLTICETSANFQNWKVFISHPIFMKFYFCKLSILMGY